MVVDIKDKLMRIKSNSDGVRSSIANRVITAELCVSPNGNSFDGSTWEKAFQTIPEALDAASTDANDLTLIKIAPHATWYEIDRTGDPTWTGNYEIIGTHRLWALIRNVHASATSTMKFTGKVSFRDMAIFHQSDINGLEIIGGGWRIRNCGFNSESLNGEATSVYINGTAGTTRGGIMEGVQFVGHYEYTKALHIDDSKINEFHDIKIHKCLTGLHIDGAESVYNSFRNLDIGDCSATVAVEGVDGIAIDIDNGSEQFFNGLIFHHNTIRIADAVGDSTWNNVQGEFDVSIEPNNFTGVTVATHATANTFGTDTEVRAAATATKPFKVVAYIVEGSVAEKFRIRFSSDSGATHFADIMFEGELDKKVSIGKQASDATDHIFNKGTKISASAKSESGGDSVLVWLKLQII